MPPFNSYQPDVTYEIVHCAYTMSILYQELWFTINHVTVENIQICNKRERKVSFRYTNLSFAWCQI